MTMILRFQTAQPQAARNSIMHLRPDEHNLLGLPKTANKAYGLFSFPTIDGKTIWLDVEIDHYYYAAWLLWSEHARLCGLITCMEIVEDGREKGGEM